MNDDDNVGIPLIPCGESVTEALYYDNGNNESRIEIPCDNEEYKSKMSLICSIFSNRYKKVKNFIRTSPEYLVLICVSVIQFTVAIVNINHQYQTCDDTNKIRQILSYMRPQHWLLIESIVGTKLLSLYIYSKRKANIYRQHNKYQDGNIC